MSKALAFSHTEYDRADFDRMAAEGRWVDRSLTVVDGELPDIVARGEMPADDALVAELDRLEAARCEA